MDRERLRKEGEAMAAFYEARCDRPECQHSETKHDVDGGALDGACSVTDCACPKFLYLEF